MFTVLHVDKLVGILLRVSYLNMILDTQFLYWDSSNIIRIETRKQKLIIYSLSNILAL